MEQGWCGRRTLGMMKHEESCSTLSLEYSGAGLVRRQVPLNAQGASRPQTGLHNIHHLPGPPGHRGPLLCYLKRPIHPDAR